jgi:YidC/Oxa1 family membrane protein insertase
MDQRNLLLAIVISVGILIGFNYLFQGMRPPPPTPPVPTQTAPAPSTAQPGSAPAPVTAPGETAPTTAPPPAVALPREQVIASQPRVRIETPRLHGSIALKGGRIDDLMLAIYHETTDPKSPEVVLLSPTGSKDPYFAQFGWCPLEGCGKDAKRADLEKLPGPDTLWVASEGVLKPNQPLTLTWDNGEGLVFTRTIAVDENYMFTVRDAVRNSGTAPVSLKPYGLISRTGTPPGSAYYILHEGLAGYLGGHVFGTGSGFLWLGDEDKYSNLTPNEPRNYSSEGGWLGFTDKYWLAALIPAQDKAIKARFIHTAEAGIDRYQADYVGPETTVAPNGTAESTARLFAGAKEVSLLDQYRDAGIPKFDLAIDWGLYYFLTKPIFVVLQFFHGLLGNFGLAILLLTLIIKLLFFPLANKSYAAMSKMKLLQPEMQKIRERFPDDKPRQQQEIMAMYKRVGANPLAGCLPIVIQIPVFFSLYKVLFVTIEMRHAPFFGWIHDLSAPDPTSFANLFGLIPFQPPYFLAIGAWPLIMGVTMFLQQKLNPQPVDPVQARMFMLLPVVFTYMLSSFPAGLVIYWAWNNLLSIAQQWAIMHRAGAA